MSDTHAELVAGLRALADWYEQHPDAPTPNYPQIAYPILGRDDVAGPATVERFAAIAGIPVRRRSGGIEADLVFGPVKLHVYYHFRDVMAEYEARQKVADSATPEQLAEAGYVPAPSPSPAAAASEVPEELASKPTVVGKLGDLLDESTVDALTEWIVDRETPVPCAWPGGDVEHDHEMCVAVAEEELERRMGGPL